MMPRVIMIAAALTFAATAALAQSKNAIQKLNDQWAAAFNRGDAATLAAMYTEDAYVLPAGADMVHGRTAIAAFWAQTAAQLGDARLTSLDVLPLGVQAAREIGTFHFATKGQSPQAVDGKYAVVWRRVGRRWQLATDIWNMNK